MRLTEENILQDGKDFCQKEQKNSERRGRWRGFTLLTLILIVMMGKLSIGQQMMKISQLRSGDILFQHLNCGPLCEAIESVTSASLGKKFAHCGMLISDSNQLKVIEAIGKEVQLSSLHHFLHRSQDTTKIVNVIVGRLKSEYQHCIPGAIQYARQQVHKPYDDVFLMDSGRYYCSELMYDAYKAGNQQQDVFYLAPMTFKEPGSKDYFPAWVDYFRELHCIIPEGKSGINPGSISRSDKLELFYLQYDE